MADDSINSVERTDALNKLIQDTIASLGGAQAGPFDIEANYEAIELSFQEDELCPVVKIIKR